MAGAAERGSDRGEREAENGGPARAHAGDQKRAQVLSADKVDVVHHFKGRKRLVEGRVGILRSQPHFDLRVGAGKLGPYIPHIRQVDFADAL